MAPFWVVLRESMYIILFEEWHVIKDKIVTLRFRVFNGHEQSGVNGEPPYLWQIVDDVQSCPLSLHQQVSSVIVGVVRVTGVVQWSLTGGTIKGFTPTHARDLSDIFTTVYFFADRHMTLTGCDVPSLPSQVMIIPHQYET